MAPPEDHGVPAFHHDIYLPPDLFGLIAAAGGGTLQPRNAGAWAPRGAE